MKTVWLVNLDRYADESLAKSGRTFSLIETGEILVKRYHEQKVKPEIRVITIGVGAALADYLTNKKIPVVEVTGLLTRIGSADVLKLKGE